MQYHPHLAFLLTKNLTHDKQTALPSDCDRGGNRTRIIRMGVHHFLSALPPSSYP